MEGRVFAGGKVSVFSCFFLSLVFSFFQQHVHRTRNNHGNNTLTDVDTGQT